MLGSNHKYEKSCEYYIRLNDMFWLVLFVLFKQKLEIIEKKLRILFFSSIFVLKNIIYLKCVNYVILKTNIEIGAQEDKFIAYLI